MPAEVRFPFNGLPAWVRAQKDITSRTRRPIIERLLGWASLTNQTTDRTLEKLELTFVARSKDQGQRK
jgi:hypothetical protein